MHHRATDLVIGSPSRPTAKTRRGRSRSRRRGGPRAGGSGSRRLEILAHEQTPGAYQVTTVGTLAAAVIRRRPDVAAAHDAITGTRNMPLNRDLVLGSWRMISWAYEGRRDRRAAGRARREPRGIVVYTPERVTFLMMNNHRTRPERLPPSDEEKIALFDTMFAYSGTYTVEWDRVVHHVDLSWNEAWSGTDQVRFCTVDGSTLTFSSTPGREPVRRPRGCPRGDIRARDKRAD